MATPIIYYGLDFYNLRKNGGYGGQGPVVVQQPQYQPAVQQRGPTQPEGKR